MTPLDGADFILHASEKNKSQKKEGRKCGGMEDGDPGFREHGDKWNIKRGAGKWRWWWRRTKDLTKFRVDPLEPTHDLGSPQHTFILSIHV
jgi:hypothetical protein